ncbi:SNF1-related protein kinase regulatory subunit gamma-1-like protein [Tanacetum coccineum]
MMKSYRWEPYIPVLTYSSMLSILLLLSKYRLRNVPVIEPGNPLIKNFITQSAVVQGLEQCKGRNCFDAIFVRPITELGLPFVSKDKLTVKYFLNTIAATSEENMKVVSPITCKVRSTLGDVTSTLSPDYIHRIYVIGDSNDFIGIITLRDFLLHHRTFKLLNGGPWI